MEFDDVMSIIEEPARPSQELIDEEKKKQEIEELKQQLAQKEFELKFKETELAIARTSHEIEIDKLKFQKRFDENERIIEQGRRHMAKLERREQTPFMNWLYSL